MKKPPKRLISSEEYSNRRKIMTDKERTIKEFHELVWKIPNLIKVVKILEKHNNGTATHAWIELKINEIQNLQIREMEREIGKLKKQLPRYTEMYNNTATYVSDWNRLSGMIKDNQEKIKELSQKMDTNFKHFGKEVKILKQKIKVLERVIKEEKEPPLDFCKQCGNPALYNIVAQQAEQKLIEEFIDILYSIERAARQIDPNKLYNLTLHSSVIPSYIEKLKGRLLK